MFAYFYSGFSPSVCHRVRPVSGTGQSAEPERSVCQCGSCLRITLLIVNNYIDFCTFYISEFVLLTFADVQEMESLSVVKLARVSCFFVLSRRTKVSRIVCFFGWGVHFCDILCNVPYVARAGTLRLDDSVEKVGQT